MENHPNRSAIVNRPPFSTIRQFMQRRFIQDTLTLQSGQFLTIFVQGFTNIVLLRILGPDNVGLYTLTTTFAALLGILDLSASGRIALIDVAKALGNHDNAEVLDSLAYFIRINLIINGILVAGFFFLAPWLAQLSYSKAEIGLWARWLALLELTELPYGLLALSYQCKRQMKTLVMLESSRLFIASFVSVSALLLGWGIPGLILGQLTVSGLYMLYGVYGYRRLALNDSRFPAWQTLLSRTFSVSFRSRLRRGIGISLSKNVSNLGTQLPILMMGRLDPVALGYFSVALKVVTLPQPLISGIARNLDTFLPYQIGKGMASLRDAFLRTTLLTGLVWSVITFGMAVVSPIIMVGLFGFKYAPAIPILYPLLIQSLACGFGVGLAATTQTTNHVGIILVIDIVILICSIPVGYFLIAQMGAVGGAWLYSLWFASATVIPIFVLFRLIGNAKN
jgi:PST family polysaccharide transporter